MVHQKGFSLVEVLISLMLVTTMGLALLAQQAQTGQLLTQLGLRAKASQFLDQIDESLFVGIHKFPIAPSPYFLKVTKNQKNIILCLSWSGNLANITRSSSLTRAEQ
ncbi:prepilin-type N-terminal cleavage/methylation domain-containing protein [Legionella antarctica]|uniref:Prepilin-type N-terminal cleavage/methylation domain-containing protein n=1 Tax=Legionella antarctica TaxID=2708020 RepID=A0A6F8T772_9GAMM|nr:prepilin-type N-terminal cleavage/methylation domain-containing protein [Legionella antarctica]BCA96301.1 prepilin-type N-terminal cleavage/methylation domain-containing protein [Legionella antarctica]